MEGQKPAAHN